METIINKYIIMELEELKEDILKLEDFLTSETQETLIYISFDFRKLKEKLYDITNLIKDIEETLTTGNSKQKLRDIIYIFEISINKLTYISNNILENEKDELIELIEEVIDDLKEILMNNYKPKSENKIIKFIK